MTYGLTENVNKNKKQNFIKLFLLIKKRLILVSGAGIAL